MKTLNLKLHILNKKGFTLIELLIVVSIIGVLAALLMANFIGVRQRARDAQRKTDLRYIQAALEMYRADEGVYPPTIKNCPVASPVSLGDAECSTTYMQTVPSDSTEEYYGGRYCYETNGSQYAIVACLENSNDQQGVLPSSVTEYTDYCPVGEDDCSSNLFYLVRNP